MYCQVFKVNEAMISSQFDTFIKINISYYYENKGD